MAGAFQIIREQMPQFLDEPHAREFRDVAGALIPTTPQDVALSALFGPGRAIRGAGAAFLAAQPTEAEAAGPAGALARLATRSGPDLRRWLDEAIEFARRRRTHDAGEAERIERIAKELPVVPRVFSPKAVAEKATFAEPNSLVGMTPRQFEQVAWPLDVESVRPYIEHYKDLVRADQFVEPAEGLFTPRGLKSMREDGFKGFADIPFLQYRQMHDDMPLLAQRVTGHEGRHRNKAIEELFGPDEPSLVHMMPGYNQPALSRITNLYPEVEDPASLIYRQPIELDRKLRFAKGGLARHIESLGFTPEDAQYAMERFEEERQYLPHRGATNYESRPERYMIMAPHKIVPKEDWKYGSSVGGTHSFLEGIQVPNRSWNWVLPEVLSHEAQHANVGAMPLEEITSREEVQKGILNKLMEYVKPLHPAKYPAGVTGRELIQELAPELIAAEGYLPAGQSLIHSELGKRIFQSPEEKLWYMSRRYPPMRDPEVKDGYLDAITSAAPR